MKLLPGNVLCLLFFAFLPLYFYVSCRNLLNCKTNAQLHRSFAGFHPCSSVFFFVYFSLYVEFSFTVSFRVSSKLMPRIAVPVYVCSAGTASTRCRILQLRTRFRFNVLRELCFEHQKERDRERVFSKMRNHDYVKAVC